MSVFGILAPNPMANQDWSGIVALKTRSFASISIQVSRVKSISHVYVRQVSSRSTPLSIGSVTASFTAGLSIPSFSTKFP